jgi:hypothetical protein
LGKDNDQAAPEKEEGYLSGYHLDDTDDSSWQKVCNLLLFDLEDPRPAKLFNGYGWFRCWFELDPQAKGDELVLCLGGYDQQDWNQYWVYLNGTYVGHRSSSGRWRTPGEFTIRPDSPQYGALRFGAKNLLAVRTYQFDKRLPGMSEDISDRFHFSTGDRSLCDQFIAVGRPYLAVSDFRLRTWKREGTEERPRCVFELYNEKEQLEVSLHYELEQFLRRKWLQVRNVGKQERLLLDVEVDDLRISAPTSDGGYGLPVMVGGEVFAAIEHPAALNQGMPGRIRLRHFPGTRLARGKNFASKFSIVGVAPAGEVQEQFIAYLQARSPRSKNAIAIYHALGVNPMPDSVCWNLDEKQTLELLGLSEKWQGKGFKFDYFVYDNGWQDDSSDYTRFRRECFPDGPQKVMERLKQLGIRLGLWMPSTFADWSLGNNPNLEPSRVAVPGGQWPEVRYRDDFLVENGQRHFCLASEPYFTVVRDALLYQIRKNDLALIKPDTNVYYCNSSNHLHLPGKYSTEADFDRLVELAKVVRGERSDIYIMWYGVGRSPFLLLYGNSMWENGLAWEAATTGDFPVLFFRDGVNLALDQSNQFSQLVPPLNRDSFGTWIAETGWGNFMKKERWRPSLIMDLARGSLFFPQLWGNLDLFDNGDVEFLVRINRLVRENERLFLNRKVILGDPWKNEPYGYAYFQGTHGFIFMNNVDFQARPAELKLTEEIGLKAPSGTPLTLRTHFPERDVFVRNGETTFKSGEVATFMLRPFEVVMMEVWEEGAVMKDIEGFGRRELPSPESSEASSYSIRLEDQEIQSGMEVPFANADRLMQQGYEKRIVPRRGKIPRMNDRTYTLAVVLRLRKNGKWWRHDRLVELLQVRATVGGAKLHFEPVPNHVQRNWAPWLVLKSPASSSWANEDLRLAITAYLPPEVELSEEVWLVPNWWE